MKMNDYINAFANHLEDALTIGDKASIAVSKKSISTVLICGLGGSGIGGSIIKDVVSKKTGIPITVSKGYSIPSFVNKNTLVIACSYSGNTEETISSLEECLKKNAEITIITSGGKLQELAIKNTLNHIIIPGGHPPRAMFGYGFTQLFFILNNYKIITDSFKNDFTAAISLIKEHHSKIKDLASSIAEKLHKTTPIIYVADGYEGVAIRLRQQINENSKMLCWHHVVPEMNHNELLGWRTNTENLSVLYLRNENDYYRNDARIEINQSIVKKYTNTVLEVWSKGDSIIENSVYLINLGDWISWYLSVLNNVDAIEIDVINFLKEKLSKI